MSSKKNKIALNSSALLLQTRSWVKNSNSTKARILKKSSAGSNMNKKGSQRHIPNKIYGSFIQYGVFIYPSYLTFVIIFWIRISKKIMNCSKKGLKITNAKVSQHVAGHRMHCII